MASASKTPNLNLPQWVGTEKPERTDFNAAFDAIDDVMTGGSANPFTNMPYVGTAPIIESGSNANGSYVKYADGTMLCSAILTANASGWLGDSGDAIQKLWTFPVAFFNVPTVFSTLRSTNTPTLWKLNSIAYQSGDGKSVATIAGTLSGYVYNSAHTATFNAFAIGRWKA